MKLFINGCSIVERPFFCGLCLKPFTLVVDL